ncbi:MAG TPA: protein phosphatase 2C domain-containing protein, partial [bacterium]|nr:protein phosphatase 2C domain-containing protein [bacterium]
MNTIDLAARTDVGLKRTLNEDSFGILKDEFLYFVCDGMGGHAGGDFASSLVRDTVLDLFRYPLPREIKEIPVFPASAPYPDPLKEEIEKFVSILKIANRRLFNLAVEFPRLRGMGTTFSGVRLFMDNIILAHVGDSRIYRLRGEAWKQLTQDHSYVNELIQDGEITEEEAKKFSSRNVITRALGTRPRIKVDVRVSKIEQEDLYLITTDGLLAEAEESAIEEAVRKECGQLDPLAEALVGKARAAGGSDNITVILAGIREKSTDRLGDFAEESTFVFQEEGEEQTEKLDKFINQKYPLRSVIIPLHAREDKKKDSRKNLFIMLGAGLLGIFLVFFLFRDGKKEQPAVSAVTKGTLMVRSQKEGGRGARVRVYRDEMEAGDGFLPTFFNLEAGTYTVVIEKEGYEREILREKYLEKGKEVLIEAELKPLAELFFELTEAGFPEDTVLSINDEP